MKPARVFLPAILSALLLWTAFFPLDLGPVAFVAMVPFLTLVRAAGVGPWRRYGAAFLGGLVFFGLAVKWVRVAHPMMALFAWPGITIYCALYWPLALLLLRKLDRFGLPLAATFPAVWVGLEYVRMHFPTGFPFLQYVGLHQLIGFGWYDLGYAMHRISPLIQAADFGGIYLISLAVAAVNGIVYDWAVRVKIVRLALRWPVAWTPRTFTRETYTSAAVLSIPTLMICYGTVQLAHLPFPAGPRVHAIQGDLPQYRKDQPHEADVNTVPESPPVDQEYFPLARQAATSGPNAPPPDLIVWPETCWADDWWFAATGSGENPEMPNFHARVARYQQIIGRQAAELTHTNALLGLNAHEWTGTKMRKFNSALLIRPDGTSAERYDKVHLVPFGEYVPLKDQLPWLQTFTPYKHEYSCAPGESWTRFTLPTAKGVAKFGVLICYEDTDPSIARRYNPSAGGEGVDFLVNISNDGWFDGTEEHEEHLAVCRFRAIEARRSVVRAVNMGISAVIDPDGRIVALPVEESWEKSKKTRGIVRASVPLDARGSIYAFLGDWVPALCWLGIVVGLVLPRRLTIPVIDPTTANTQSAR
ncbi:apolipoprotein N-acyltransferase [Fimbriiglobus ruber]|uniref:Apolipoprotein N-acyltransferase n=1 Tax=Fimbriiglobus ruber TaxID=1908690 RepID=A0A225E120_9BACT|nr:apolipoprotein N-acyltransferase [Fimbriiglobus ruber]OWK46883.1 Apolipoprotein N-acyltransferase [Fimbriiglobus ruber]